MAPGARGRVHGADSGKPFATSVLCSPDYLILPPTRSLWTTSCYSPSSQPRVRYAGPDPHVCRVHPKPNRPPCQRYNSSRQGVQPYTARLVRAVVLDLHENVCTGRPQLCTVTWAACEVWHGGRTRARQSTSTASAVSPLLLHCSASSVRWPDLAVSPLRAAR